MNLFITKLEGNLKMFKKTKLKKYLAITLIAILMVYNTIVPSVIFAQEVTDTPTPTPDQSQTTIDNTATDTNTTDTTSNTGDNTINPTPTPASNAADATPTPTPDLVQLDSITPTLTDTPVDNIATPSGDIAISSGDLNNTNDEDSPSTDITNNADVSNNSSSLADTGENAVIPSDSLNSPDNSCQPPQGGGNIDTGDAVSVTAVDNSLNSTSVNSQVVYQTINLFLDSNGDINLSDPFTIASAVIPQHPDDSTINVNVTNVNNYAYLNNNVVSIANTGDNTINGSGGAKAIIDTGDAYSIVSILNKVNFTIINSTVHIITINIFGNLNGNIILPDFNQTSSSCATCGISLNASNNATVTNNVDSQAISGQNTINGSGSIDTGDADSSVNLLNLINSNFSGININGLYINVLGAWDGNFIGWGDIAAENGGSSLTLYETGPPGGLNGSGCSSCTGDVNITNNAIVDNNVTSTANTGGNTINGKGKIITGNAFSLVSLINFVNTNFINSSGFFGFLNIFGNWHGNIGGKSNFDALAQNQNNNDSSVQTDNSQNSNDVQQEGGSLSITNSNNVGAFVNPGDTVTFFVKVKNTGSGKVYGAKVDLYLIKDGKSAGGKTFDLGDIEAGKGKTLTTGFVLSKKAPRGLYIARAEVYGNVGPDNSEVNALADSFFNVSGHTTLAALSTHVGPPSVLGSQYPNLNRKAASQNLALYVLLAVIFSYAIIRALRQRKELKEIFTRNISFKEKVVAFRMFLL